ncbi:hypothetical protein AXG93_3802s1010 [Marchantia polymorpha subsp. ruderalis]|uniref:Uncharacterized protein n=1 Tax=Marchantia polymorpha subsp. ruderalis TaxID=1480154 RepID=A0A176VGV2_MARPO|nr:hypothetical protein AXG93_3802s1010 [Marchantia polymorpha subsp. ruderalis]
MHVERWIIADWEQVLGRCAGEGGHLLFDSESIKVTKEEEISFAALFKSSKSNKNGYKTRDYKDRYRRNVAVALLQLLQPHKTTYITTWQCQLARQADEDLIRKLQSECGELRAQRAEAELQLMVVEDNRRWEADHMKEELVKRVNHCLRGYTLWEVAAQEKLTLRELELRAAGLMSGDSRSRRRVAKKLDSYLSRSRDAMANLEAEVTAVLRRLGLRSRAEDWSGRELARGSPSRRRHSR